MTRYYGYTFSGETRDAAAEKPNGHYASAAILQTTDVQTGGYGLELPLNVSGTKSFLRGYVPLETPCLLEIHALLRTPGAPAASGLTVLSAEVLDPSGRYVRIGTDTKLRFYDKDGNQLGDPSTSTFDSKREAVISFDGLTLQNNVLIALFVDGVQEVSTVTGLAWDQLFHYPEATYGAVFGENLAAGVNRGARLRLDDAVMCWSLDANEAPHLYHLPRLRMNGGMNLPPTSEGAYTEWEVASPDVSPDTWKNIDDTPGNDGDTSHCGTNNKAKRHLFKSSATNPIPADATIHKLDGRAVVRSTGASKFSTNLMLRLGGADLEVPGPIPFATTYAGYIWQDMPRPGGGPWTPADLDPNTLEFGWKSYNHPDFATGVRVTLQPAPVALYSTAVLPLAASPFPGPTPHERIRRHQIAHPGARVPQPARAARPARPARPPRPAKP
ncbi:MAG: hypothetical protein A2V63_13375 [Candidatus Eisenbacteria bacterium RBG_19FT_COMBO_70_11]|nr:MAG: hypothetical protein A2V63_13375 [Candidatus Eisenbacteria bacterium RBG_19FT_COMBO_70_11]